jgi:hypothetical protein
MPGGKLREAADILVPFRDHLISIQVKSRTTSPSAVDRDREIARLGRRIGEGVRQIKTIMRAIDTGRLETVETARGFRVPFDCSRRWQHVGVVILDTPGEEERSREEQTRLFAYMTRERGIPTHVFHRLDFELIAHELNTLPDFLEYLQIRTDLIEHGLLAPQTLEHDLLALHKMNYESICQVLAGQTGPLVLEEGIWDTYRTRYAEDIARRDARNKVSYIVDEIIERLHMAVGFDIRSEDPLADDASDHFEETTTQGYMTAIADLASLTRVKRKIFGELIRLKTQKAIDRSHSYGVYIDPDANIGYVVVCTSKRRGERRTILENVAHAALCVNQLPRVVGVATEPADEPRRSYDAILAEMDALTPEGVAVFTELGRNIFAPLRHSTSYEFE